MSVMTRLYEHIKKLPLVGQCGLLLIAVLLAFNGYTVAKYVFQQEDEPVYAAENFYFESDALKEQSATGYPSYTLKRGVDAITVDLRNYPDALRRSEVDLKYEVRLINKKDSSEIAAVTGTLYKEGTSVGSSNGMVDTHDIAICFSDETEQNQETWKSTRALHTTIMKKVKLDAGTYTVIASVFEPYKHAENEVLKADYIVSDVAEDINFSVADAINSPILRLTITTADMGGEYRISWKDSSITADNTDPKIKNIKNDSCDIELKGDSQYTIVFFKNTINIEHSKDTFSIDKVKN